MIVLITSHAYTHLYISLGLTCWFTCLYSILIVFEHDIWITVYLIVVFSLILCVDMMIYLSFAWLRVAWLPSFCMIACRLSVWVAHLSLYFPPSGFSHFLHFGSHFCKCEALCACTLTEIEVRNRVWRRAIPMFGGILEENDTLMSIGVRSLKTCIAPS